MKELNGLVMRYPALEECRESIAAAVALLENAFRAGGKLLVCVCVCVCFLGSLPVQSMVVIASDIWK